MQNANNLHGLELAALMRDAAAVRRYHTRRMLREQTLAEHSFGVQQLILQIMPEPPARLLVAAIHHDLPEYVTGDVPGPAKRASPRMEVLFEELEKGCAPLYLDCNLTPYEEAVLKWCDTMELVLFCLEEVQMGNAYAGETVATGLRWVRNYTVVNQPTSRAGLRAIMLFNGALRQAMSLNIKNLPTVLSATEQNHVSK